MGRREAETTMNVEREGEAADVCWTGETAKMLFSPSHNTKKNDKPKLTLSLCHCAKKEKKPPTLLFQFHSTSFPCRERLNICFSKYLHGVEWVRGGRSWLVHSITWKEWKKNMILQMTKAWIRLPRGDSHHNKCRFFGSRLLWVAVSFPLVDFYLTDN